MRTKSHRTYARVVLLIVAPASIAAGVHACRSRNYNPPSSASSAKNTFNDILEEDFDSKSFEDKIARLQGLVESSAIKDIPRPGFGDAGRVAQFVSDSIDFRTRPLAAIASLGIFSRLRDVYPKSIDFLGFQVPHRRLTHPVGAVGVVRFVPKAGQPYTGLFAESKGALGVARFSTATNPYVTGVMNRAVAIKFPVSGGYSRSLIAMHRIIGQKVGENQNIRFDRGSKYSEPVDYNFFHPEKNLTNILPPGEGFEAGIAAKFADVTRYVRRQLNLPVNEGGEDVEANGNVTIEQMSRWLSVANMAWTSQDGQPVADWKAPARVTLKPNAALYKNEWSGERDFRNDLASLTPGTVLYTVYASGDIRKERDEIVAPGNEIGQIVLERKFHPGSFGNEGMMFKHFVAGLQTRESVDKAFRDSGAVPLEKPGKDALDSLDSLNAARVPDSTAACLRVDATAIGEARRGFFKSVKDVFDIVRSETAPYCFPRRVNANPGFPKVLDGVWWMDGNPLPDVLINFGNAEYDATTKRLKLPVHGAHNFSFYGSPSTNTEIKWPREAGSTLHGFAKALDLNYRFEFDLSKDPISTIVPFFFDFGVRNSDLVNFTFVKPKDLDDSKDDGAVVMAALKEPGLRVDNAGAFVELTRRSSFLRRDAADYSFRKVIDGDGKPVQENYELYLETMRKFGLAYQLIYKIEKPGAK